MIFGTANSKFVSGATTVDLPSSVLDPSYIIPEVIEHQSVVSGKRNWIPLGYYSDFKLQVNLFKYDDPNTSFNLIESYKFSKVTFYPHKDGDPIKDIFGNESQLLISDIEAYYLTNEFQKDIAIITFLSDRYTRLTTLTHLGYGYGYGIGYGDQL